MGVGSFVGKTFLNRNIILMFMFLFIDRKEEMSFLDERYHKKEFDFFVIYGRRRIGKTELIKHFIKNKPHIYVLCNKAGTSANILKFRQETAKYLSEPEIASENLEEIFSHLVSRAKERKPVVVFDEFSYLVEKDDAVPSMFQAVVDEVLSGKNFMLVICGSSISMMETLLGYKNPLYGRKTGHLKIDFMKFRHFREFFPHSALEENIKAYAILGGVPFYLEKFDKNKTALENAKEQILSKTGGLYEEVDFLLKEEFREPDTYKAILSAIASGSTKVAEMSIRSGIKASDLDRYLKALIALGIIRKDIPATEKKGSKKTLYSIDDNFFDFYSLFFEPHRSDIEIGETHNVNESLKIKFNAYVGKKFEKLVRTEVIRKVIPFQASKVGRWWGFYRDAGGLRKELEIDVVALSEQNEDKQILFCECKWQDKVDAERILAELNEKAQHVDWNNNNGKRREHYVIVAKSFSRKVKAGALCLDLDDLAKLL